MTERQAENHRRKTIKEIQHPQETVIRTYDYNGIAVDLVEWSETLWCGKIAYADDNAGEPDVEKLMADFMPLPALEDRPEADWDVCMSFNYLTDQRPCGVLFGSLAEPGAHPEGYDLCRVPAARFLRMRLCGDTAKALGHAPWEGGVPPYQWIGEQIAPGLGYTYGSDALPVVEYYGFFDPERGGHEYCYLYVPAQEMK